MDDTALTKAIFERLQNDTTLRGLLGKSAFPWGVYKSGGQPSTPDFPNVTVAWGNSSIDDSAPWEDDMTMVTITVNGGDLETIRARIATLLRLRVNPFTVDGVSVDSVKCTSKGVDLWDKEFRVWYRPSLYVFRYRLHGNLTT